MFCYNTVSLNRYVRKFYQAVVLKMMRKFPFKDTIIQDLRIIDPRKREEVTAETGISLQFYDFIDFVKWNKLFKKVFYKFLNMYSVPCTFIQL